MSQQGSGTALCIAAEHDPCLLLEVDDEVLSSILTSANDHPDGIKLKSGDGGHAVLCIDGDTYELRSVQTSNSVYMIQPHIPGSGTEATSLLATTKCSSVLELAGKLQVSAQSYLQDIIPTYHGGDLPSLSSPSLWPGSQRQHIYDNVPLSDAQCDLAWQELFIFEGGSSGFLIPSPRALIKAWSAIMTFALASDIKLDGHPAALTSVEALSDEIEDIPADLVRSIVHANLHGLQAVERDVETANQTLQAYCQRIVVFVGKALLQDSQEIATVELIRQWQTLLPEAWREHASLGAIKGMYDNGGPGIVRARNLDDVNLQTKTPTNAPKRKWHERFKSARDR